jgi:hypothetical protein
VQTLRTFHQLRETQTTQPSMTTALDFINAASFPNTSILSQILIIQALANQPLDALTNELTSRLQHNGGLGDLVDYDRTIIDTALTLEALAMTAIYRYVN